MLDRPVSPRRAQADSDEQCAAHPAHNPPSGKGTTWWPPDRGRAHSHPIPHRPSRAHQGGDSGRGWAGQAKPIPPYASPTPAICVHMPKQDPLTRSQYRLCVTPQVSVHLNTYHCTLFNLKRKMWEINPKRRGSNKSQNIQKKLKEKEKGVKNYSNFKSKMCTKF